MRTRGRERLESVQEGNFKWIQAKDKDAGQLFDVSADPGEQVNLAAEHPQLVERLSAELARIRKQAESKAQLFEHSEVILTPDEGGDLGALGYTEDSGEEDG